MNKTAYRLGLIGYPLGHSLSPQMHAAALKALGLEGEYRLFPVAPDASWQARLRDLLEKMRQGELHGLNVTIPHKQAVIPFLDALTPTARAIGAVNTIFLQAGRLVGDNTDCPGFLADLAEHMEIAGFGGHEDGEKRALVMGAGGSARAVVYSLAHDGWQVLLAARRPVQAEELVRALDLPSIVSGDFGLLHSAAEQGIRLIVNATPLGMSPNVAASPWPVGLPFPPGAFVYDLVYNPAETALLKAARQAGLPACGGLRMLARQAVLAFQRWTGCEPPWEEMYAAAASLTS